MKNSFTHRILRLAVCGSLALLLSCSPSNGQSATDLAPKAFSEKMKQTPNALILDVRTPEEYAGGHIKGAQNVDWNAGNFEASVAGDDKARPVMVYCLAGGRSSEAAQALRKMGFQNVYEMHSGMMGWRKAKLPEEKNAEAQTAQHASLSGLSRAQYDSLVSGEIPVLVDFYAEWCGPCKKMKPSIDELAQERAGSLRIERIDADKNEALVNDLGVVGLPTLMYYKDSKQVWKQVGFMTKEQLKSKLP